MPPYITIPTTPTTHQLPAPTTHQLPAQWIPSRTSRTRSSRLVISEAGARNAPLRALGRTTVGVFVASTLTAACHETEERIFEHHIEIGDKAIVSSDSRLCQADFLRIERAVAHAEDVLAAPIGEPIRVYLYDHGLTRCISGAAGCLIDGEIHTLWQSIDHEIVHAVAQPLGRPRSFWSEGMAEAISNRTQRGSTDVEANLELTPGSLDYHTAGHFVRWLMEEHGEQGMRPLAEGESLPSAFGVSLSEAIADYEANAPWSYPRWNPCPGDELAPIQPNRWLTTIDASCSERGSTTNHSIGTGALRTIEILESGSYRLMIDGGVGVKVIRCQTDILEIEPTSEFAGDIRREDAGLKPPSTFVSGQEHLIRLEAGKHEFRFGTGGGDGEQLLLDLARM
jgi:hypothetical protein